ncbi:MAG: hypothetical protein BIFFINMI_04005 [Phycisphaerae bacterium]|nr:hypothetical protein [Phycisphaerae bacterium]
MCGQPLGGAEKAGGEPDAGQSADQAEAAPGGAAAVEQSTIGVIARLFVLPLLIVVGFVGLVMVLRMAGCWASSKASPEANLQTISEGVKNDWGDPGALGTVGPRSKKVMIAAINFALQVQEIDEPARKAALASQVEGLLAEIDRKQEQWRRQNPGRKPAEASNRTLQDYLVRALAQLAQPSSLETILRAMENEFDATTRQDAVWAVSRLSEAGALKDLSDAKRNEVADAIVRRLSDDQIRVQMLAAQAAGHIGADGNARLIDALKQAAGGGMGELVAWNAALSLVNMHADAPAARDLVRDKLLNRPYLESAEVRTDEGGRGKLLAENVRATLIGAAQAAGDSADRSFVAVLEKLKGDPEPAVRDAAIKALRRLEPTQ